VQTLINLAEQQKIIIDEYPLGEELRAIYLKIRELENPIIFLNKNLSYYSPETRCVLAEELGHYFTTIGNALYQHRNYSDVLMVNKIEKAAIRWAGHFLIPNEELYQALQHGQPSLYELAQKFNVTEGFAKARLQIFKEEEYALRHGTLYQRLKTTAYLAGSFSTFKGRST
jgi:Zn-dependent peptidase ImmA (M78 family)